MLYYKKECFDIIGAAMQVYNILGNGFLESVYQEAFEIELVKRNIAYEREKELVIFYEGIELQKKFYADFLCFENIIVELKAVSKLENVHRSQLYNYLKATGKRLGLLINFGSSEGLDWERIVN
jgi:GxxExxY protein